MEKEIKDLALVKMVDGEPSESFKLEKVKLGKHGGIDIHYTLSKYEDEGISTTKYHIESSVDIHPDFREVFESLKGIAIRALNIDGFLNIVQSDKFNANDDQIAIASECYYNIEDSISVTGVSMTGEGENRCAIISLKYEGEQDVAFNTPKLVVQKDAHGFEIDLEQDVISLTKEAYAFLFENKKAQLELFDGECDGSDIDKQ